MDTRKRSLAQTPGSARLPLKETNGNIPAPALKKSKLNVSSATNSAGTANNNGAGGSHAAASRLAGSALPKLDTNRPILTPTNSHNQQASQQQSSKSTSRTTRLVGDELLQWQVSWRRIMKESTAYFDTQGCDVSSQTQQSEQKRASRSLRNVGCTISPFFERNVTIIISRRPFDSSKEYPSNDIFHDVVSQRIKVWNYGKVFRFLNYLEMQPENTSTSANNLGASVKTSASNNSVTTAQQNLHQTGELYNLLKEEKIFGNNDRDPNAKRDDLHYLEKNFLYSYDLSQTIRPIAVREWHDNSFPVLSLTLDGKCPFIADSTPIHEQNSERRKLRRIQKFEATKGYRDLLKEATTRILNNATGLAGSKGNCFSGTSTSTDRTEQDTSDIKKNDMEYPGALVFGDVDMKGNKSESRASAAAGSTATKYVFKAPPVHPGPLIRQSSVMQPNDSNSKYYEVAASGFNGASNAAQCSMDSILNSNNNASNNNAASHMALGNGLGPSVSQVPSKNINNLKRRIFMKKQKEKKQHPQRQDNHQNKDRVLKPGYCENCRVKYDHFEDHIISNRHRNFACDDSNFKDIDDLIATLNESKSLGYVTSNGDYKYA